MADGPTPERRAQLGSVGLATGLGCSVVVTLIAMIGGGVLLDRWKGTEPVFTLVGLALGLVAAGYELWELARIGGTGSKKGPLTRGIEKIPVGGKKAAGNRSRVDQE